MGKKPFFVTIDSIDLKYINEYWNKLCDNDREIQKKYALNLLIEDSVVLEDPKKLQEYIEEVSRYNESLISFGNYRFELKDINDLVKQIGGQITEEKIDSYILDSHKKWDPAIAIQFKGKTIIGGWVAY